LAPSCRACAPIHPVLARSLPVVALSLIVTEGAPSSVILNGEILDREKLLAETH
jgi:hypothetical protein